MGQLWADPEVRRERGTAALARVRERFTDERFYSGLMSVYEQVSGPARP
jgi:hypothetical protein